jgi:ATP-dependent protease ClpP protease subunit
VSLGVTNLTTDFERRRKADALMAQIYARPGCINSDDTVTQRKIVLRLFGQIGPSHRINLNRVKAALSKYPTADLMVELDSPGGNLSESERIAAAIGAHKGFSAATVREYCFSAATVILLACRHRQCSSKAKFLIHQVEIQADKQRWTAGKHRHIASVLERSDRELINFYHQKTGRPRSDFQSEIRTEDVIDCFRAKFLGLIHGFEHDYCWDGGRPYHRIPEHRDRMFGGHMAHVGHRQFGRVGPIC